MGVLAYLRLDLGSLCWVAAFLFPLLLLSHPPMSAVGTPFLQLVTALLSSGVPFARVQASLHRLSGALTGKLDGFFGWVGEVLRLHPLYVVAVHHR